MATIDSIVLTQNCDTITVTFSDMGGDIDVRYYNSVTETEYTDTLVDSGDATTDWVIDATTVEGQGSFNGVITLEEVNGDADYIVSTCEIDCCIASLVESAINCTCECDKCDDDLRIAEKVQLLIVSAKHSTYSQSNVTDATEKYNKAKDFCTATCACGC
jgi:hypothetical protein